MKRKLLVAGLVSLCLLVIGDRKAVAGIFDWWCFCHNKYTTQITCRPYNAFTPICWGNLVCDGCCPNPCACASGCLPMTFGAPPFPCNGCCPPMGCGMPPMMGGCGAGGCGASDMGPMTAGPPIVNRPGPQPMPYPAPMPQGPAAPGFPPMPMPVGPNTTMMYPQNYGVSQAAYYPMPYQGYYMPNYAPNYTYGWQPMPSYWYGQ